VIKVLKMLQIYSGAETLNPKMMSMYDRLADFLVKNIDFEGVSVILEAGCGNGNLTIPLTKNIMNILREFKFIALDITTGPYKNALNILRERARKEGLEKYIKVIEGDVRSMSNIDDESIDLIISNELLCDLDREGLEKAIKEFYRVLKLNGQMAHAVLSPVPENPAQKLLIKADSYSIETLVPKYEWFSPFSDEVAMLMHRTGFKNITVKYFETNVHLSFNEAVKQLKDWKIKPIFVEKYRRNLKKFGLELPMEYIIFCKK